MKYQARCSSCLYEVEYESPITDPEKNLPECPQCVVSGDSNSFYHLKMEKVFTGNSGGFILKGPNWAKKAGY